VVLGTNEGDSDRFLPALLSAASDTYIHAGHVHDRFETCAQALLYGCIPVFSLADEARPVE